MSARLCNLACMQSANNSGVYLKILILTTFFPPLNSIASLRPYSWAKYWALAGHDVTVVTVKRKITPYALDLPNTGFHLQEIEENRLLKWLRGKKTAAQTTKEVQQVAKPGRSFVAKLRERGVLSALRMPDITDLWIQPALSYAKSTNITWDLVVSTAGPYAPHAVAYHLKQQGRAKQWIADFRDLWVDHHFLTGVWPFTIIEKHLENKYVAAADLITVVTPGMEEIFSKKYPKAKVALIENGIDSDDWQTLDPEPIFPNDRCFRIVYTGTIQAGVRDPSPLFEALAECAHEERWRTSLEELEILFAGPSLGNLDDLIAHYQVGKWVKNIGMKSRTEALRMQRDADMLLFLEWDHPSSYYMLTGKLFEYLATGNPILALGVQENSDSGKLMLKLQAGSLCLDKITTKHAVQNILQKIENYAHKQKESKTGSAIAGISRFERKHLAEKLLQLTELA